MNYSRFYNHYVSIKILINFCFFVIFYPGIMSAQQAAPRTYFSSLHFDHLNFSNGLSFDGTRWIVKDKQGFIWISTQDGLNKYDGINFKIYHHDERNLNAPASNEFGKMALDSKGNIWMASADGLIEYFPVTGNFKKFPVTTKSKITSIDALYIDAQDIVWFGDDDGLQSLNAEGKIETFPIKHLLNKLIISSIIEDNEGIMWVGTQQGLYSINKSTHEFHRFVFEKFPDQDNTIMNVFRDHENNIWVGTWGRGLGKLNKHTGTIEMYTYNKSPDTRSRANIVLSIYESSNDSDKLWIGTGEAGLGIFDKKTKTFDFATINGNDPHAFNAYAVYQIFDDHFGTLWFATDKGVVKLNSYLQQFQVNKFDPSTSSVRSWYVTKIIIDTTSVHHIMWIGTYGSGLVRYDPQTGSYASYIPNTENPHGNEDVNDFAKDKKGKIWITTEHGFYQFDPERKSFIAYKNIPGKNSLPLNRVGKLTQTQDGKLWMIVKGNGFCSFDPNTKQFQMYNKIFDENNDSINKSVFCITKDAEENIWGGTQFGGIFIFNPKTEKFIIYNLKNGFSNQTVYSIVETDDKTFWIATYNGLWNFNLQTKKIIHYTTNDGLCNNVCYKLIEDEHHFLWITTLNGLAFFDPSKKSFQNYSTNDGLLANNLDVSFDKGADGKFYLGFNNSYNFFDPDNIIKNELPPPVAFTSFKIFGKEILLPENNSDQFPLQLSYKQNMLSFEFAALNYTVPQKNQYAYKLEGADKDWTYSGSGRQATYNNLSGGDYIFHVKAANNDGVWNEAGKSIFIHITPPFWMTWWFRTLIITLIFSAVYVLYRRRIADIRKEEEKKTIFNKQLAQIEMKALKAQMNPHFIFNCMNSINSYILQNDKKMASDYLTKFSTLIRLILENSDKPKLNLADELAMLETYIQLEQNRLDNKFDYSIHVDPFIKTATVEIPSLILQPFIENAIWHGLANKSEKGNIHINIRKELNALICVIEDNGIGRASAAKLQQQLLIKHESMGMKVTEDRLKILNQLNMERPSVKIVDLFNNNNEPCGTNVEIIIPL